MLATMMVMMMFMVDKDGDDDDDDDIMGFSSWSHCNKLMMLFRFQFVPPVDTGGLQVHKQIMMVIYHGSGVR